jgi:cell division protein DivIC
MEMLKKIWTFATNKYFLATALFLSWILFFAKNNIIQQYTEEKDFTGMRKKIDYLNSEIEAMREEQKKLQTDPKYLEKFAREHYKMKREGETVFVFDTVKMATIK